MPLDAALISAYMKNTNEFIWGNVLIILGVIMLVKGIEIGIEFARW